jgi:hypothetical protein
MLQLARIKLAKGKASDCISLAKKVLAKSEAKENQRQKRRLVCVWMALSQANMKLGLKDKAYECGKDAKKKLEFLRTIDPKFYSEYKQRVEGLFNTC